jgi:hypothetical protein
MRWNCSRSLCLPGGAVHVLADDLPLLGGSELPQLRQLVLGVLPGILLADSGVEGDLHAFIVLQTSVL